MCLRLHMARGSYNPVHKTGWVGFKGPTIADVESIQVLYKTRFILWLTDEEAAAEAHAMTAWPFYHQNSLEMVFHGDLLKVSPKHGPASYYADWEVCA